MTVCLKYVLQSRSDCFCPINETQNSIYIGINGLQDTNTGLIILIKVHWKKNKNCHFYKQSISAIHLQFLLLFLYEHVVPWQY